MSTSKVVISIDKELLKKLDYMVDGKVFSNRSQAIQMALREKIERMEHGRLVRECMKLNPDSE